jgi:hypothetical protein
VCNPSIQEAKVGRLRVQSQPGYIARPFFKKMLPKFEMHKFCQVFMSVRS